MTTPWIPIGTIAPDAFAAARRELHWAAQAIAAAADANLARAADDSHTNMGWDGVALIGHPIDGRRVALRIAALELALLADDGRGETFALRGRTLDDALAWLGEQLGGQAITPRDYAMPPRPARFGADAAHTAELARWTANAFLLTREVASGRADANGIAPSATPFDLVTRGPVAMWPHHFDVGSIALLDGDPKGRRIGFGVSLGDAFYEQPYLYVTPHPVPPRAALPPLAAGGTWHRAGFTGAVLTATTIAAAGSTQHALAKRFFASAIEASLAIVAGPPKA